MPAIASTDDRIVRWSAPGRVNLIGEHLDYNGGPVLPFAIQQRLTATVRRGQGSRSRVSSAELGATTFAAEAEPGQVTGFAARVAGVAWALRQRGHDIGAVDVRVSSHVPLGAGLSSSAALGCAVASAIVDLSGLSLCPVDIATVAHDAESRFAGVPSGVMDQMAAMLCATGHALLLDCSDLSTEQVSLDLESAGMAVLVIDTGVRHEHALGEYGERRAQCEAAATELGLTWLSQATTADLARLTDPLLRRRTAHVVSEVGRVTAAVDLLGAGRLPELGPVLTASHESLRDDFEVSCPQLDVAVEAALDAGAAGGRMTGGGFGGCAIALCRRAGVADVEAAVSSAYHDHGWARPRCWTVTPSAGAHPEPPGDATR